MATAVRYPSHRLTGKDLKLEFPALFIEHTAPDHFPYASSSVECKQMLADLEPEELRTKYVSWVILADDAEKKPLMYWVVQRSDKPVFSAVPTNMLQHFHTNTRPTTLRSESGEAECDARYFAKRQAAAQKEPRRTVPRKKPWVMPEMRVDSLIASSGQTAVWLEGKVRAILYMRTHGSPLFIEPEKVNFAKLYSPFVSVARYALRPDLPGGQVLSEDLIDLRDEMKPAADAVLAHVALKAVSKIPRKTFYTVQAFRRIIGAHFIDLHDVTLSKPGQRCWWTQQAIPPGAPCLRVSLFSLKDRRVHTFYIADIGVNARTWIAAIFDCVQWPVLVASAVRRWATSKNRFGESVTTEMRLIKFLDESLDTLADVMAEHIVKMEFVKQRLLCP